MRAFVGRGSARHARFRAAAAAGAASAALICVAVGIWAVGGAAVAYNT